MWYLGPTNTGGVCKSYHRLSWSPLPVRYKNESYGEQEYSASCSCPLTGGLTSSTWGCRCLVTAYLLWQWHECGYIVYTTTEMGRKKERSCIILPPHSLSCIWWGRKQDEADEYPSAAEEVCQPPLPVWWRGARTVWARRAPRGGQWWVHRASSTQDRTCIQSSLVFDCLVASSQAHLPAVMSLGQGMLCPRHLLFFMQANCSSLTNS